MTEDELYRAIHSDINGLKATVQRVADQMALCNNRIQVVENRMNRHDSGARRMSEEAKAVEEKLDTSVNQNAQILLALEIAKADREATIRTIKWLAGAGAVAFPALMWLIQHGNK
jgi:hypothetical protein